MNFGNAPCSWGINYPTGNRFTWAEYLDQVAAAGYAATELGPYGFLPRDPAELKRELDRRDLALIGATHVHRFSDAGSGADLLAVLDELGALLVAVGAGHLVIMDESNAYPAGAEGQLDADGWRGLCDLVRAAQEFVEGKYGLKASFHPHVLTAVEYEPQIDRLLQDTDIDLCFDTGHHAFRLQDPLAFMARVWPRIAYMHLKNVDPGIVAQVADGRISARDSFAIGAMCPLPDGSVDIKAVVRMLEDRGFGGPVVVEQDMEDNAADAPATLAARNLRFLQA